ncbi:hypothetical protein [Halosimplex carlsbadense]|uniref:hypothetical protein n=1 Tax=Halosimplex carlsbadense TaxID=171164 RepID=UPI001267C155|nr:hypothetical protein [Halosimplex carlsbadense]
MGETTELEVYYIPGAENRYEHDRDLIILDSKLKEDYPQAHDYILEHERQHHDETVFGFLIHEFRSDFRIHFSTDPTMREVRKYISSTSASSGMRFYEKVGRSVVKFARWIWFFLMLVPGFIYRRWAA